MFDIWRQFPNIFDGSFLIQRVTYQPINDLDSLVFPLQVEPKTKSADSKLARLVVGHAAVKTPGYTRPEHAHYVLGPDYS